MDADGLRRWRTRLYSRLPLVGGWLRQGAVRRLAEDDSPEAVRLLAEAVARTDDSTVRLLALEALQEVERPRRVDAVCEAWAATRDGYLEELLTIRGWGEQTPPAVRVLYLLVKGAEEALVAGGAEIVEPLLQACRDADAKVAARARQVLGRLQAPEARDALCQAVIDRDDALAREVALAAGYAPRAANGRALFYFLTAQWEAYEGLDFDHGLLRAVYQAADGPLRQRLAAKARQAGRVEWVEVVTGGRQPLRLGEMTDAEWQTTLEVLTERRQWPELWRLAQEAPARWSARLLQRLQTVNGGTHERLALDELARLAAAWQEPDLSSLLRLRAPLTGHTGAVRSLAVSPDGLWLASGSQDQSVRLWGLPDGAALPPLTGHRAEVAFLGFSPKGKLLASGGADQMVRFWNVTEGRQRYLQPVVFPCPWSPTGVTCLAVSPGSNYAIGGCGDGVVRMWPFREGLPTTKYEACAGSVDCIAVSGDAQLFAAGSRAGGVGLWVMREGRFQQTLRTADAVWGLTFSPDNRLLIGRSDRTISLWDVNEGGQPRSLTGHARAVTDLAVTADGQVLASASRDHTVRLWGLPEGQLLKTLAGHTEEVTCLAVSPDGRILASGSADRTVELWGLPDGRSLGTLTGHTGAVHCLAASPDGRLLASAGADHTVRLWASEPVRLSRIPAGQVSPQDLAWAQGALGDSTLSAADRAALEFLVALVRHRRRFDIHLDEATRRIRAGEFDIEILG